MPRVLTPFESASVFVTLLGAPSWRSSRHGPAALSRKDAALFALLAIDGEWPRDRIAGWLWPEVPIKNANLNLRQRLFKLRQTSGHALIESAVTLRLLPQVAVDVQTTRLVDKGLADKSLADLGLAENRELLAGHDLGDLPELDEWLQAARAKLAHQRTDHLAGKAALLEAAGALAEAIALCERIVGVSPWHEHSWRRLMRLHYLRADRASAIHAFERFERLVREELGSRPSAETIALLEVIERSQAPAHPGPRPLPTSLIRPPLLIGRQSALAAMNQAWADGRAILLIGAGGIGKTRLMTDFVQARSAVLSLRARPGDAGMPYATVGGLLQGIIERHRLNLTPELRIELSRLLPDLGTAPRSEGQQTRLWKAVESAIAQAVAQGLGSVTIDDLHFADAASVELLRWLLASPPLAPLRWCFAARPDEPEPATPLLSAWLGDSNRLEPVRLLPLGRAEVQALVDSLALPAVQGQHAATAEALYRHAGGHPFYTLETLKALLLSGTALASSELPLPLPAAAQAMVERRLSRLSPDARDLLRLAALAGADLALEMAAAILQRPLIDLAQAWVELEAAQVMQGHGFAHDLVRECALATVPQAARAPLHRALAVELQRQGQADPARLAAHWSAAGEWRPAAALWRRAATAARVAGRMTEHERFLRQAADACAQAGDAPGRFDALCEALAATLLLQGSQAALDGIVGLAALASTDLDRARVLVLHVEALLNLARFSQALELATEALRLAPPGSVAHSDAISLRGRCLALTGRAPEAIALLQQAAASAQALADEAREMVAVSALAHAYFASGLAGQAVAQQQRAVELAQRSGDLAEMASAAANLATLAYFAGDARIGQRSAGDAEQRFAVLQADGNQRLYNRIILARCAAHLGQLDVAWAALQAASQQTAADSGDTSPALAGIALAGLKQWLGVSLDIRASLGAWADDPSPLLPMARAGLHLAQARFARLAGADESAALSALQALEAAHPALRDDPALYLDWSRFGDPRLAVAQLSRLRERCASSGADGLDRSLAVRQVDRLMDFDRAGAARLAGELHGQPQAEPHAGMHPATYPPEAWWILARALRHSAPQAAQACRTQALGWIAGATLPDPSPAGRARFEQGNPLNRVVLAGW